jgi:hypothetical protein
MERRQHNAAGQNERRYPNEIQLHQARHYRRQDVDLTRAKGCEFVWIILALMRAAHADFTSETAGYFSP